MTDYAAIRNDAGLLREYLADAFARPVSPARYRSLRGVAARCARLIGSTTNAVIETAIADAALLD